MPRSALAAFFFLAFGIGGLVLGVVLFPLLLLLGPGRRSGRARRALVRFCYRLFVGAARVTGLFRVVASPDDRKRLASLHGCVVVANHTTLIDVVILLAILPDATAVAKAAAGRNFFYSRIVNGAFIVNDDPAGVLEAARRLLSEGVNIVIFPEGTRTPPDARERKLRRGAAQMALHAGSPVHCVRIASDPQVLAKGQPWWDVADRIITFSLSDMGELPAEKSSGGAFHSAAVTLTERIRAKLFMLAAAVTIVCLPMMANVEQQTTTTGLAVQKGDPFRSVTAPRNECRVGLKLLPRNNMPLMEAEVDGAKGTFLLDTGATHTTFDLSFVRKKIPQAKLTPVAMMAETNVEGAPRYMRVKSMKLGAAEFGDFGAMALDISHLHASIGAKVDGILGMSTLGRVPCIVAFGTGEVVFAPSKESLAGFGRLVQRSLSDPMSILLPVKLGERTFEILVDSGASFTFLSRDTGWPTTDETANVPAVDINGKAKLAPLVGKKGVLPVGDGIEVSPLVVPAPMNRIGADVLTAYDMLIAGRYVGFKRRIRK